MMDARKRDAQVEVDAPSSRAAHHFVAPDGRPVSMARLLKGTEKTTYRALLEQAGGDERALAERLADEDPEIDLLQTGRRLRETSRVFLGPGGDVIYSAQILKVVYGPDGQERSRGEFVDVEATVGEDLPPVPWTGRLLSVEQVVKRFAISRQLRLRHINGLTFDFLFEMADQLHKARRLMLVGSGRKGQQPLIFHTNGTPFRGFLAGETRGESYRLILHLSNLELKRLPEAEPTTGLST